MTIIFNTNSKNINILNFNRFASLKKTLFVEKPHVKNFLTYLCFRVENKLKGDKNF